VPETVEVGAEEAVRAGAGGAVLFPRCLVSAGGAAALAALEAALAEARAGLAGEREEAVPGLAAALLAGTRDALDAAAALLGLRPPPPSY